MRISRIISLAQTKSVLVRVTSRTSKAWTFHANSSDMQPAVKSRVGRQLVNIPSFMVRADSQKHIDFSLTSPFTGGHPSRVKRKNQKVASKKASGGDGDEEDEE